MYIKQVPAFKRIAGKILSDLSDKIMPITLNTGDRLKINTNEAPPILILSSGEAKLKFDGEEIQLMKRGEVYGEFFQEGKPPKIDEVVATERTVLFRIELVDFYFVMALHHDLAQGLIYNVTKKEQPA
jgi:hypothetical protein